MLTNLLSILDRLMKMKEYRDQRLRRIHDQLLEPAFNDLLLIHRNYIEMFESVREMLPKEQNIAKSDLGLKLQCAAEYLRQKRIEFEPVRIKLRLMMTQLGGTLYEVGPPRFLTYPKGKRKITLGPEADAFIDAVIRYFPDGTVFNFVPPSGSSMLLELLKAIDYWNDSEFANLEDGWTSKYGREIINELISATVNQQRSDWSKVCESYAALKISIATMR